MDVELKKKLDELAGVITVVQEKNDSNEKKYDGLLDVEIKDLSTKAGELAEEVQKITEEKEEQKKRLEDLEAIVARGSNGDNDEKQTDASRYDHAIAKYMRKGVHVEHEVAKKGLMDMLRIPGMEDSELEAKTMQVGVNPDGGYWVRPERIGKIVDKDFESSPVRSVADVVTTASDSIEMVVDDDEAASGGWVSESAVRGQTNNPQIGLLQLFTHEQFAEPKVTQKLLDDAGFDVGAWLQRKINSVLGRTENTAFVSGNGVGKPKGFLDYAAWAVAGVYERNKLESISSGAATALTADGLIDLQNSLHDVYQGNANFIMKRQSWGSIIKLKETLTGAYLIDPTMLRNGAGQLLLLGRPVFMASDMPAIAAASLSVAYGDFRRGYTIVDKVGLTLIRDNVTDKGRVKFYTSKRTGGGVTNFDSIKIQKTQV